MPADQRLALIPIGWLLLVLGVGLLIFAQYLKGRNKIRLWAWLNLLSVSLIVIGAAMAFQLTLSNRGYGPIRY